MSEIFGAVINEIINSPAFGLSLTLLTFCIGTWINRKLKTPLANPMLISVIISATVLVVFNIPYSSYEKGGDVIEIFLTPMTALLSIKIYQQLELIKKNWLPIFAGAAAGAAVSIICVWVMCKICLLEESLTMSLLPKSVTAAIAVPLSEQNGGVASITAISLAITGVLGAMFSPFLIKIMKIKNPVEAGIAIGTSSHALGTAKAVEIGDVEGAMSSCAIGIAGLITAFYILFI